MQRSILTRSWIIFQMLQNRNCKVIIIHYYDQPVRISLFQKYINAIKKCQLFLFFSVTFYLSFFIFSLAWFIHKAQWRKIFHCVSFLDITIHFMIIIENGVVRERRGMFRNEHSRHQICQVHPNARHWVKLSWIEIIIIVVVVVVVVKKEVPKKKLLEEGLVSRCPINVNWI